MTDKLLVKQQAVDAVIDDVEAAQECEKMISSLSSKLTNVINKNDKLLESIESMLTMDQTDRHVDSSSLLYSLRDILTTTHTPNSVLRRELLEFSAIFVERLHELLNEIQHQKTCRQTLDLQLKQSHHKQLALDESKDKLIEEQRDWREKLNISREEILQENERLKKLSQQLARAETALNDKNNDLASQRIAFEEERLFREDGDGLSTGTEVEEIKERLKKEIMRNMDAEQSKLRAELAFQQKCEAFKNLAMLNERLEQEARQIRLSASKTLRQFEKQTSELNFKISELTSELTKSKSSANRFQELISIERRKQNGMKHVLEQEMRRTYENENISPTVYRAFTDTLTSTLSKSLGSRKNYTADDVVRKNELLLFENASLRADVKRLRIECNGLRTQTKASTQEAYVIQNQALANFMDRVELHKRLDKATQDHKQLEQSLNLQASDWVSTRHQDVSKLREKKWTKIAPIPVLGAAERSKQSVQKPKALSRPIQVDKW